MLETPEQRRGLYEKKQQQYRKSSKKQQYGPGTFNKLPVIFRSKITESLMFQRDIHCLFYNLHGQEKSQDTIACLKKQQVSQIVSDCFPCVFQNSFHKSVRLFGIFTLF